MDDKKNSFVLETSVNLLHSKLCAITGILKDIEDGLLGVREPVEPLEDELYSIENQVISSIEEADKIMRRARYLRGCLIEASNVDDREPTPGLNSLIRRR